LFDVRCCTRANAAGCYHPSQFLSRLETRPHDTLALKFISDFLYGEPAQLPAYLQESTRLLALKTKDSKFWVDLIKRYADPFRCLADRTARMTNVAL
jgi:hypothetical protein